MKPNVSIVMPNYNSPVIDKSIEAIMKQDFKGTLEVIVVGKDEPGLLKPRKGLKIVETKQRTIPSKARNIGLAKASADTIVFVDSDCIPEQGWLSALVENRAEIVTGPVEFKADNFWTSCDNFVHFYASNRKMPAKEMKLFGSIQLKIPKSLALKAKGFDESLETGEDLDFAARLMEQGKKCFFEPNAVVRHYPNRKSLSSVLRHSMYWAKDSIKARKKHGMVPIWMKKRHVLLAISPVVSTAVTLNVYTKTHNWRYIHLFPIVWLAKLAWLYGAFRGLKNA